MCLSLLASAADASGKFGFVATEGQIRAQRKEHPISLNGRAKSGTRRVTYWHHASFPKPDPLKKRLPIATSSIHALRKAVGQVSTSAHQRYRRHVLLKLLEITGARRAEVALISTKSICDADFMQRPMLRIATLKKRSEDAPFRLVPVSRADLAFIKVYIDVYRRSIVRRQLKGKQDHGLLLVSERTGDPLNANTLTQEIKDLAKAAKISQKACPHMFRHRFITKLFVALIEQHEANNRDSFRQMLISSEQIKTKILEWTGQASIETLDRYIDLAFDEISNYQKAYDVVHASFAIDSFLGSIEGEIDAISAGEHPQAVLDRVVDQLQRLRADIECARAGVDGGDSL
jgi:integrase